jgi:molecular chaperone HtpG
MDSSAAPFLITQPEFMRRMKEMQATGGGGMFGMGNMPEMYNLVVNTNSELVGDILQYQNQKKTGTINQSESRPGHDYHKDFLKGRNYPNSLIGVSI